MRIKLHYRENRSFRLYWKQFNEKYNDQQISSRYDNMGYDYIFKTYLNRLYNHEVAKGNNTFDYRSYETFTQMYTTVYEMAHHLRFFSDSQEKILESEAEEDIRVFSRYREEEIDEFEQKMEKLRKVDHSYRKKIATIDFNTFVAYQMGFCTIDLSDTANHSLFDLGFEAFHNFVNTHRWKDTNETLNRNFLFYQNTSGSCEHRFNYIHKDYHHGHFHQKNSRTGAKFYLFSEHDEITNEDREKLNTSLNESFLKSQLPSILPKTQEAYHEAAVKICQKKVNNKHKCRFVLTTTNDCIYPRESDNPFILFLNPHKNIKVVIGI
ncbi:unnamed protein product, partial [Mesorhabditis belari]|uniref:Uncharacterized protein n=1 Tax=Mesorhabditis belari TaxID=2138241 RepID=A0AAF3EWR3_9BILA